MKSNKDKCLTFKMQDLVATTMIMKDRAHVTIDEVFALSVKLHHKMEKEGVIGKVMFSNEDMSKFSREYAEQFYVGVNIITMKNGYNLDWLTKNITPYLSVDQLEFLGFVDFKQDKNASVSN